MGVAQPQGRSVALIGAYERDNFGDLLFLIVTETLLARRGAITQATGPFPADMTDLLDRHIPSLGACLRSERFDAIWTVGGELGGITLPTAYRMSATDNDWEAYRRLSVRQRAMRLMEITDGASLQLAYIPQMSESWWSRTRIPLVVNSVGLHGARRLRPRIKRELVKTLRNSAGVSVRDRVSSEWLNRYSIDHLLAPDVVHLLPNVHPVRQAVADDRAILQVSRVHLTRFGMDKIVDLVAMPLMRRFREVRIVRAGAARGHDPSEELHRLAEIVNARVGGRRMELSPARRPLDIVDEIACSGLWLGSSMHGRIVAAAYEVPRISFASTKVDAYASQWDADMPFRIMPQDLNEALSSIPSAQERGRLSEVSQGLADLATSNFVRMTTRIEECDAGKPRGRPTSSTVSQPRVRSYGTDLRREIRWQKLKDIASRARLLAGTSTKGGS